MADTLPFPNQRPPDYIKLTGEPEFNASRHLALEKPDEVISLQATWLFRKRYQKMSVRLRRLRCL